MNFDDERKNYVPNFVVGKSYRTLGGSVVKIISESNTYGVHYRTVQGDDGGLSFDERPEDYADRAEAERISGYRYDRFGDVGRCTASAVDCPRNLIPGAID